MTSPNSPIDAQMVDGIDATDLYADAALSSFCEENGVVRITLATTGPLDAHCGTGNVVVWRLVMPAERAHSMSVRLLTYLQDRGIGSRTGLETR